MPQVSVVMAHAGSIRHVREACQSLGHQTFRDVGLIVVDDGGNVDWQQMFQGCSLPFQVVKNDEKRGLAYSLNRAASLADSAFLARMDSDDRCAADRLERQIERFDASPKVDFLGTSMLWIDDSGAPLGRSYAITEPEDLSVALLGYNQCCHGSMIMRRSAFEAVHGYNEAISVSQDYDLWLRALRAGHQFANLAEPLYEMRLHQRSASSTSSREQQLSAAHARSAFSEESWLSAQREWFQQGRSARLNRPYEQLQLAKMAVLFAARLPSTLATGVRGETIRFIAQHLPSVAKLALSEVGWRHGTSTKFLGLLRASSR